MSDLQARIATALHTAMDAYVEADGRRRQAWNAFQSAKTAADEARGECDRLICAAAALRGDPIPKGSALDGARQVELMAHDIERRSGGAA